MKSVGKMNGMTMLAVTTGALCLALSGCASVRGFMLLDGPIADEAPPIHDPFTAYAAGRKGSDQNLILRSRKGDRAMELELPPSSQRMTDLTIPVGAAFKEPTRAPASDGTPAPPLRDQTYLDGIKRVGQLFRNARYELAILEADKMLRDYPTDSRLYVMRGTLLERVGQPELAIKSWNQALRLDPQNEILRRLVERKNVGKRVGSP